VPVACELVTTVRDVEPEPVEAVMVTVEEFVALQLSVTICPEVMVLVFAEKITVGVPGLLCVGLPATPLQAQRPKRAQIKLPQPIVRKNFSFILPRPYFMSGVQMLRWQPELLRGNPEATGVAGLQ
jgi:hypothetical protein